MAGRAEDPVTLLPALEDAAVDRERQRFGQLGRPPCRSGRRRLVTHPGASREDRVRGTVPATSGRAEVPSSKKSLALERLVPRLVVHLAAAARQRQRPAAPRSAAQRPDTSQRQSVASRRRKPIWPDSSSSATSVRHHGDHLRAGTSRAVRRVSSGSNSGSRAWMQRKNRSRRQHEVRHVEDRVMRPRQAVERPASRTPPPARPPGPSSRT